MKEMNGEQRTYSPNICFGIGPEALPPAQEQVRTRLPNAIVDPVPWSALSHDLQYTLPICHPPLTPCTSLWCQLSTRKGLRPSAMHQGHVHDALPSQAL